MRVQEIEDPGTGILKRTKAIYRAKGYSDGLDRNVRGIAVREELTD